MDIETKTISRVAFRLQDPEVAKNSAVVKVISEATFANGKPVEGGLFDLKMGPIDFNDICATCDLSPKNCVGHFGYLELAAPVYHPQYMSEIKKVIETVCFSCSRVILEESQLQRARNVKKNKFRLQKVKDMIKTKKQCPHCGFIQPVVKKPKNTMRFTYNFTKSGESGSKEEILTPSLIMKILSKVSNSDAEAIGFSGQNRPEWMIMTILKISPPVMRPTIVTDSNQRGEDDLTVHLVNIIKANNLLEEKLNNAAMSEEDTMKYIETLNFYITAMTVGSAKGGSGKTGLSVGKITASKTGRPVKSLNDRMSGKPGRFRKNLMGKRVDQSARSVITPDPNLDIDQLGVPLKIAKIITFPEIVNNWNKERIYQYITNAKTGTYPYAISIKHGNDVKTIEYIKEDIVLEVGDIVTRQIIDGDIALFNRQPTLHRMSMMAFRIKVMSGKTFRINLSVTSAFNADFDGDKSCLQQVDAYIVPNSLYKENVVKLGL